MNDVPWGGVYAIRNDATGRLYVGASDNLRRRQQEHERARQGGNWSNKALRADLKTYGPDAFSFHVLQRTGDLGELRRLEAQWAQQLRAFDPVTGYNTQPIRTPETWDRRRQLQQVQAAAAGGRARLVRAQQHVLIQERAS